MIEPWMHADTLMHLLMRRGEPAEFSYEIVERVAHLTLGGMSEIAAIERTLGYCPHEIRAYHESQTTSQKESL